MINWDNIDTVLLDMDGTLLDLHYDNYFWLEHLPQRFAQSNQMPIEAAKTTLFEQFSRVQGQLKWYCIDYWTAQTKLDIRALKQEVEHKIAWKNSAKPFLHALEKRGIARVLLTNAHPDSLALKIHQTHLDQYLDSAYSTHQFGYSKESPKLWEALLENHPFDPKRTLFVDDNEGLLAVSKAFGVAYQLGISEPDSTKPATFFADFPSVGDYESLTQELLRGVTKQPSS
jgi:putative hydrolase of the HAD superfamily